MKTEVSIWGPLVLLSVFIAAVALASKMRGNPSLVGGLFLGVIIGGLAGYATHSPACGYVLFAVTVFYGASGGEGCHDD